MDDILLTFPSSRRVDAERIMRNLNAICRDLGFVTDNQVAMRETKDESGNYGFLIDSDLLTSVTYVMVRLMDIDPEESEYQQLALF